MAAPTSIQRLQPFPSAALALLERITSGAAQPMDLRNLIGEQLPLLDEVAQVAVRSGRCPEGQLPEFEPLLQQLGAPRLAEIALTVLVRGYMRQALGLFEDYRYWHYTLACGLCCEQLAGPGQQGSLLAYTGGLLHDVGRLALIAAYPNRYSNLLSLMDRKFASGESFDILDHERLLFGLDHFATGVFVANAWRLPPWLRSLTGRFEAQVSGDYGALVSIVRAGTRLANSLGFGYLRSAPRSSIQEILAPFPDAWKNWKILDNWQYGEEHMREKIHTRFQWYAIPDAPDEAPISGP